MAHPLPTTLIGLVALITLFLTILALRAWLATGNKKLLFVVAAFGLFFTKSVVTATALATDAIGHETLEMLGSAFDLAIVLLLVAPFLLRR